jgi:hypothetical protein
VHGSTTDVALIANAIDNGPDGLLDLVDGRRGFQQALVVTAGDKITVADLEGEIVIEHPQARAASDLRRQRPPPRPTPRPLNRHRCPETSTVTDVLRQNCHRCPETAQA